MSRGRCFYLLMLLPLVLVTGCGFHIDKNSDRANDLASLSFADVRAQVFEPRCLSCHGGQSGIECDSYASVKANIDRIRKAALGDKPKMPPDGPLSDSQKQALKAWIDAGAPEFAPTNNPAPASEILKPNFASINKLIFEKRCTTCHSDTGQAKNVSLAYDQLLNSPRELVIPGNPDESGLWIALNRTDDKRMPQPPANPLKPEELSVIKTWIQSGAPSADKVLINY